MMIPVVDRQDQVIGYKERSEIDGNVDIFRVSALWVINSMNEVLIAQRKLTKAVSPGVWGPSVAGTVEEGETYESNIYKEAEEEIGVASVTFEQGQKLFFEQPRMHFVQLYIAHLDRDISGFTPQEEEVETLEWKAYDDLVKDVDANPDKYILTMKSILSSLAKEIKT